MASANKPKGLNGSGPMNSSLLRAQPTTGPSGFTQSAPSVNSLTRNIQNMTRNVSQNMNYFGTKVSNGMTNVGTTVSNTFSNAGKALTNTVENTTKSVNTALNTVGETTVNAVTNTGNAIKNTLTNTGASILPETVGTDGWAFPLGVFVACTVVFAVIFVFFQNEIKDGTDNLIQSVRSLLGLDVPPPKLEAVLPPPPPTTEPPQINVPPSVDTQSIVEKILPLGAPEVFNVSKNDYTFYDAEPLCKALGAQLATYDQVKDAYERGADWCNYGWVKGQVAVYPTQKETWDSIQQGPSEERGACGKPGLNGGYFDNPELRFGVNCYGVKPNQSAHDEAELMKKGAIPKTTAGLKIDRKVQEFQAAATQLGILPFNEGKWSVA